MPSLRRTFSSPTVRSSPYPSASEHAGPSNRSHGGGHRRSSGSETIGRRVLADIEWWRVVDGQRDLDAEQESEDANRDQESDQVPGSVRNTAGDPLTGAEPPRYTEVERSYIPSSWSPFLGSPEVDTFFLLVVHGLDRICQVSSIFSDLVPLSVAPETPRRRRHGQESSSSSLESTPELPETSVEGLRLDLEYLDLGAHDADLPPYPMTRRARNVGLPSYLTVRSHSFADFLSLHSDSAGQYADFAVSPLSSHSPDFFN
ncbi:uncharacterized protein EV420DRAFT_1115377 [Desarmillaria tabescens]|uniref:Uncharacterized protein n=1 Tax=Armillaria tabescens TaxID=1929756 RepID=A0AA39NE15_ARMTA|nr:uncharacterized protein EV420DRAFT_1115377 [Desarmillaria tabescens]KAK0463930.1 hypothetical protein EV420DRAFT_1115377 [Desarmillaria tabescens]